MRKIIVPTDFSNASMEGLLFACHIAATTTAQVELIHVYSGTIAPGQPIIVQTNDAYYEAALKQLNQFISEAQEKEEIASLGVEITGRAVVGFPEIELIDESSKPETALMVMSTTGSHGISGKIFGTVSTLLARKAKCPVLLIPKDTTYAKINDMMFASAFLRLDKKLVDSIKKYARVFDAKVHCVHVLEQGENLEKIQPHIDKLEEYCKENDPITFTIEILTSDKSVSDTLQAYVEENKIGMTIMVAPKRSFFEALFHRSATKEMAFSSTVPLLVFH